MNVLELEGYLYLFPSVSVTKRFFLAYERSLHCHCLFLNISGSWHDGISASLIPVESVRFLGCVIVHLQQTLLCIFLSV